MTTDTSTAARVKATRVRQAESIVKDLDESGSAVRMVRVVLVNTNVFDFQTRNVWIRDLSATPKSRLAARRHQ